MALPRLLTFLVPVVGIIWGLLVLYPPPIDPAAWVPPPPTKLEGPYAPNNDLNGPLVRLVGEGRLHAPETVTVDANQIMYTATEDGKIWRISVRETIFQEFVQLPANGRALGMCIDGTKNRLIACDIYNGVVAIDLATKKIELLTDSVDGKRIGFADDCDVDDDGIIYFSDATTKFAPRHPSLLMKRAVEWDFLEQRAHGMLLSYDPFSNTTKKLADGIHFANGATISHDGASILVCETRRFRVLRHHISGPLAGTTDVFIDGLPGMPDGIRRGSDGTYWVAIVAPRMAEAEATAGYPFIRSLLARLPSDVLDRVAPTKSYGLIVHVSGDGRPLRSLHDPTGRMGYISGVTEGGGRLYIGTVLKNHIGLYSLN